MRLLRLHLKNFLSYRDATLELGDFTALVGPNASGKSNAVAALKLLRDLPRYTLPVAIARRGGFDQLRHRSKGRPYDPVLAVEFQFRENDPPSRYELRLGAREGKRYYVKLERARVYRYGEGFEFACKDGELIQGPVDHRTRRSLLEEAFPIPPGESALHASRAGRLVASFLSTLQIVEVDPARIGGLQDPASTQEFEPDGANAASCFEALDQAQREELINELAAIVPGIKNITPRSVADKITLTFYQDVSGNRREFLAKQMSSGTLRVFGILLAMLQRRRPTLLVIEEPEIAIHAGALRTLVDLLKQHSEQAQVLITTHSVEVVDALDLDALRIVWSDRGASRIAPVAQHTREPVRRGLTTPGELLRADALDPAPA